MKLHQNNPLALSYSLLALLFGCLFLGGQSAVAEEPPLAGVKFTCPYMPYSATASQIIYLTNPSNISCEVFVTCFDDKGRTYDLGLVTTVPAWTVAKLQTLINEKLQAAGLPISAKVCFEIYCTEPKMLGYFSYIAGGVRGFVMHVTEYLLEWTYTPPPVTEP